MKQTLLRVFVLAFCVLTATAQDASKTFPKMGEFIEEYLKAEVTLTDQYMDEISFVKEYYDMAEGRGRLDFVAEGFRQSIFYYTNTGDIIYTNATSCTAEEKEVSDFYYYEVFFGWLYKNPLIIGPSALLWLAQDAKPEFVEQKEVRGIMCDYFELTIDSEADNLTYGYYIADASWSAGYEFKGKRVPVRIVIEGQSRRDTAKNVAAPIAQTTDFSYLSSNLNPIDMQPEIGLGCFGRKPEFIMPKLPKEYHFSAEIYDLLKAENTLNTEVTFSRVWFDSNTKLARIDKYTEDSVGFELYDFNNGVTYSIQNKEICKIIPLQSEIFAKYDGFVGFMKTPDEALGLSGEFYYMGHRKIRGINCRVFEKAERDVPYSNFEKKFSLLVTTVYFSAPFTKIISDGDDMTEVPLAVRYTGYTDPNVVSLKKEFQILGFEDLVGPLIYQGFPIADCFPLPNQKSYFVLSSATSKQQNQLFEANNQLFTDLVTSNIMDQLNVSFIRIPFIRADYHPAGVTVTGLLLDRPSSLSQFTLRYSGIAKAEVKDAPGINTREKCAYACVGELDFTCKGIHFCRGFCYLNRRDLMEQPLKTQVKELGNCEVYTRAIGSTKNTEPYLSTALEALQKTIIGISFPIKNETDIIKFPDVVVDDGLVNKDSTDKSYDLIFYSMQLPAEQRNHPSIDKLDAGTVNECYRACKEDSTIDCQSFSYCASGARCRISSLIVYKDMNIRFGILENEPNCDVYSLLNLDYYTPYPGKMSMFPSDVTYTKVTVQECALRCRKTGEGKSACRGFEYCRKDRRCLLHSKHVADYKNQKLGPAEEQCTHYAAKYSADYYDRGLALIDDSSNTRTEISFEECARACSEELPECRSFNYCPDTNEYAHDSRCSMTTKILSADTKLTESTGCRRYEKREFVENYNTKAKPVSVSDGYTQSGYSGMIIGTLILGLIVGAAAFIGYSFYRSRKYNDGMSVRFMKQADG